MRTSRSAAIATACAVVVALLTATPATADAVRWSHLDGRDSGKLASGLSSSVAESNLKRTGDLTPESWWGNDSSWNRYSYVLNNPLSFLDPTGLSEEEGAVDAYDLLGEFLLSTGPTNRNFSSSDPITYRVRQHQWMPLGRQLVRERLANGSGVGNPIVTGYNLGDDPVFDQVKRLYADFEGWRTGGLYGTWDETTRLLGSFTLTATPLEIANGVALVEFRVENKMSFGSGSRVPGIGYLPLYKTFTSYLNAYAAYSYQVPRTTVQTFTWTELLVFSEEGDTEAWKQRKKKQMEEARRTKREQQ